MAESKDIQNNEQVLGSINEWIIQQADAAKVPDQAAQLWDLGDRASRKALYLSASSTSDHVSETPFEVEHSNRVYRRRYRFSQAGCAGCTLRQMHKCRYRHLAPPRHEGLS